MTAWYLFHSTAGPPTSKEKLWVSSNAWHWKRSANMASPMSDPSLLPAKEAPKQLARTWKALRFLVYERPALKPSGHTKSFRVFPSSLNLSQAGLPNAPYSCTNPEPQLDSLIPQQVASVEFCEEAPKKVSGSQSLLPMMMQQPKL